MQRKAVFTFIVLQVLAILGCFRQGTGEIRQYIPFPGNTWPRFSNLRFELPVENPGGKYDVVFFTYYSREFENESLDFHMIMQTPSGEERIREYSLRIRGKDGNLIRECRLDSCEATLLLKSALSFHRKGILKIELENLIPRMETKGVKGAGILLRPVG